MAVKMKTVNVDGVEIIKEIEESLYSQYLKMGWEEVKEKKSINLSKTKEQPKEEKKEEKINDENL